MFHLQKLEESTYGIYKGEVLVTTIRTYRNRFHSKHLYLDLANFNPAVLDSFHPFQEIYQLEQCPLQIMMQSDDELVDYITAEGFKKKRSCHELEVSREDWIHPNSDVSPHIYSAKESSPDFLNACEMQYEHYVQTHASVNPLTVDKESFYEVLPKQVYFMKKHKKITHVAFVEQNEIAYMSSIEISSFPSFVQGLLAVLFESYRDLEFEVDDTDSVAMLLLQEFSDPFTPTFDTFVLKAE